MAHLEQNIFCSKIKGLFPSYFIGKKVLDIGSLNINGCNKPLFWFCSYTGIDLGPGPNVDVVCSGHQWPAPNEYYDVVISTECGEHDEHWMQTISNAIRILKPGGLFIYTCATTGRPEHGTKRTDKYSSPFTTDYYRNLMESDMRSVVDFNSQWEYCRFEVDDTHHDLKFFGFKIGKTVNIKPSLITFILTKLLFFGEQRVRDYKNAFQKLTTLCALPFRSVGK